MRIALERLGLAVVALLGEDVVAAVAVEVADAHAVGVLMLAGVAGDGVERPGFGGLVRIGNRVAVDAAAERPE